MQESDARFQCTKHLCRKTILTEWNELRRWLRKRGCTFEIHKGGSGHLTVRRGSRTSQLPVHGARRELGKGLVAKIKKDLGLE